MITLFQKIADIILRATERRRNENVEFLKFYRELVEITPTEACVTFDNLSDITVVSGRGEEKWGIELTVNDYIWWKERLESGIYFKNGIRTVQHTMLRHLIKKAEALPLSPDERKSLLAMADLDANS